MKYLISVLTVVAIFSFGGCVNKSKPKPTLTKKSIVIENIKAPRKLGEYDLISQKIYDDKQKGIALRYANTKKKNSFLDAFIYPKTKLDKDLQTHYKNFIDTLKYMHQKGEFQSFEILKEDEVMLDPNTKSKRALFKIRNKMIPYYSVAYLAEIGDKFFKVRISNQITDSFLHSELKWREVRELFKSIKKSK